MEKFKLDLQRFAGEGGTGSGGQGGTGENGGGSHGNAGYTYDQVNEIASARAEKAERAALAGFFRKQGMSEDEITAAISDYKERKKANQPNVKEIEKERDTYKNQIQQYENEKILTKLNVKAEDLDYVSFKVQQKVTDKKDFEAAAKEFLKENPRFSGQTYRVSTGTQSGGGTAETMNEQINDAIRNAFRRK